VLGIQGGKKMEFDLKRIKCNRKIRTINCEWYTLTTDEKEEAHRFVIDSAGVKREEKMEYQVGELFVLYGCDEFEGKVCSRIWLILRDEIKKVDEKERIDFALDLEKTELVDRIRKQLGLDAQAIKMVVSRYHDPGWFILEPEKETNWIRIKSANFNKLSQHDQDKTSEGSVF
jgi:hypothetical protein